MATTQDIYELAGDKENTGITRDDWVAGIPALVVENRDPEQQDRIKVIIPMIDENDVCQKWIVPSQRFVGPKGYGDSCRPAIGTEVILHGRSNEKHNLFYYQRFNEDYLVPEELRDPAVRGFKTDQDYKALADRDIEIKAGRDLSLTAGRDLKLKGATVLIESGDKVEITAPEGLWVNGVQVVIP